MYYSDDESYVSINGEPLEVAVSDTGDMFVNVKSLENIGVTIIHRSEYDPSPIPRELELQAFERYILDKALQYCVKYKKKIHEEDVVSVFDRVKARLGIHGSKHQPIRHVQKIHNNITITRDLTSLSSPSKPHTVENGASPSSYRPKMVPDNFRPSFSYENAIRPKRQVKNNQIPNEVNGNLTRSNNYDRPQQRGVNQRLHHKDITNRSEDRRQTGGTSSISSGSSHGTGQQAYSRPHKRSQGSEEPWEVEKVQSISSDLEDSYQLQELKTGSTIKVVITHLKYETSFYVQLSDSTDKLDNILRKCNGLADSQPVIEHPTKDMMCLAYVNNAWYRASFMSDKKVFLVDYGNRDLVSRELRVLPEELKNIPAQAIHCTLDKTQTLTAVVELEVGQELLIYVKKMFDNLTHIVQVKNSDLTGTKPRPRVSDAKELVTENCYTTLPECTVKVVPGEKIMIVNFTPVKLILRNREVAEICKNMYSQINTLQKQPISNPIVGQIVLCCGEHAEGLHRAVIKKINGKAAEVEFVDHCSSITVAVQSLKNINDSLAKFPCTRIDQPYPVLKELTVDSELFLTKLINNKTKLTAVLSNGHIDFELDEQGSTILLSEKIKPLKQEVPVKLTPKKEVPVSAPPKEEVISPSPKQEPVLSPKKEMKTSTPSASTSKKEFVQVTFDDMKYVKCDLGLGIFLCFNSKLSEGVAEVTLVNFEGRNTDRLMQISNIEPLSDEYYSPEVFEVCLAFYDKTWYRALCLEKNGDEFEMLFVDFGGNEMLKNADLRAITEELTEIPILSITAQFEGLPQNPKVHERLIELLPHAKEVQVDIKRQPADDDINYFVEMPEIYEILRKEGLL